ncbi:MAG: hypothetical protein LIP77_02415 [Planctomycetes bacterium]|nr:hypothetical protein [Planctomycetota bacterium]
MATSLLAVDLGTTNTKAVLFDRTGATVAQTTRPTPFVYRDDAMELDVDALWRVVLEVCGATLAAGRQAVAAVTMASMAATFVPVDAAGRPLHAAIGWADARSLPFTAEAMAVFHTGRWIPGCGQYPLQMYLPFRMRWFAAAYPRQAARVAAWLNVSDFLYARMTGERAYRTDFSIASRTMLFDIGSSTWNRHALRAYGIDGALLPEPVAAGTVLGAVGGELRALGLAEGTPVIMGGHDHVCALAGAGITDPDTLLNTTGTSEAVTRVLPAAGDAAAVPHAWLNWEATLEPLATAVVGYVGASGQLYHSLRTFDAAGDNTSPPPAGVPIFVPPQRAQLTSVEGFLRHVSPVFDAATMAQAVRDGLAFECRRVVERLDRLAPRAGRRLRCVGSQSRNRAELCRKSAVLGRPIEVGQKANVTALGAAMAAGVGCGLFSSFGQAVASLGADGIMLVEPEPGLSRRLDEIYRTRYLACFEDGINSL